VKPGGIEAPATIPSSLAKNRIVVGFDLLNPTRERWVSFIEHKFIGRRVAVPTNKEERVSDDCESVSRRVSD